MDQARNVLIAIVAPLDAKGAGRGLRGSGLLGDDDPHGDIDHQAGAAEHRQQDEQHPDQGDVEVEVLGQAATDPGQLAVGLAAVQLPGCVRGPPPLLSVPASGVTIG